MTRDEEARLGQLMMAKEKVWIKAGLRGPLPGDVRQYYYDKTTTHFLRLVRWSRDEFGAEDPPWQTRRLGEGAS